MMLKFDRQSYNRWQDKLRSGRIFRLWWQFWSNYSFVFFVIVFIAFYNKHYFKEVVILAIAAFAIARLIVVELINKIYRRERPYQLFRLTPITSRFFSLQTAEPNSFPSRHSSSFMALAAVVWWFNPPLGTLLILVTLMTGIARVILGYHWPTDIIGGIILGSIIGTLVFRFGHLWFFT